MLALAVFVGLFSIGIINLMIVSMMFCGSKLKINPSTAAGIMQVMGQLFSSGIAYLVLWKFGLVFISICIIALGFIYTCRCSRGKNLTESIYDV